MAKEIAILAEWLKDDLLASEGANYQTRSELWDFIVQEIQQREEDSYLNSL